MQGSFPFQIGPTPKRGFVLTLVLLGMMIIYGMTATGTLAFFLAPERAPRLPPVLDPRLLPYIGLLAFVKTIAALSVWRWNRWGVYLLVVTAALMLVADFSLPQPVLGSALDALTAVLVFVLCRKDWGNFS